MSENKILKTRGVSLKTPADVNRISQRIISDEDYEQPRNLALE